MWPRTSTLKIEIAGVKRKYCKHDVLDENFEDNSDNLEDNKKNVQLSGYLHLHACINSLLQKLSIQKIIGIFSQGYD